MPIDTKTLFQEVDSLIKSGRGAEAAERLQKIRTKGFSAEERVEYAFLARRVSLPLLSLRLLKPIVRPEGRMKSVATDDEKAEYAGALIRIGAAGEALAILNQLETKSPKATLLIAFAHFSQWNYAAAIPFLRKYIQSPEITHYQELVGHVNLCDALAFVGDTSAAKEIDSTLSVTVENSYPMLAGGLHLTETDLYLSLGDISKAEHALAGAEKCYKTSSSLEAFFVDKWRAILALYKEGAKSHIIEKLDAVRKEAKEKWQHWETVRDCDFHQAVCTKNLSMELHLLFGTPYESFRKRLISRCSNLKNLSQETYVWHLNEGNGGKIWEPFSGTTTFRKELVVAGNLNTRLFAALTSDFYRPLRTASLMGLLYPDEFYNHDSSPGRIRAAVRQLREWLASQKTPLQIDEASGAYRITASKPAALLIPKTVEPERSELDFLKDQLGQKDEFTAKDVCDIFSVSQRTASRILQDAEDAGLVVRSGKARATRYHWTGDQKPRKAA